MWLAHLLTRKKKKVDEDERLVHGTAIAGKMAAAALANQLAAGPEDHASQC